MPYAGINHIISWLPVIKPYGSDLHHCQKNKVLHGLKHPYYKTMVYKSGGLLRWD